jgi:hypothetical protein
MNPKTLFLSGLAVAALAIAALVPLQTSAQALGDEIAVTTLAAEVTAQHAVIVENQTQIDARIAKIGEDVRQARIYAGRAR